MTARSLAAILVSALFAAAGCASAGGLSKADQTHRRGPAHVEIAGDAISGYSLLVNGSPYALRGAGVGQPSEARFAALVEAGGNTVRTWSTKDAETVLALAEKYDVMVALGVDFGQELHGFNYDDPAAVAAQFDAVKKQIDKYKDHPNLLMWIVGNELNLLYGEFGVVLVNPKVYAALNDVAAYIHEVDPHHPMSTAFAGYLSEHVAHAMPFVPDLDILAIQLYGDLVKLKEFIAADPSDLPIMLTEYGPLGHWEMPQTEWGREIEEPSAVKAAGMAERIQNSIIDDTSGRNIGNFAFLWGHKQERTSTWYSLFTKEGYADARVDELTKFWTGAYPDNRAPLTKSIMIDGKRPIDNIYLKAGALYTAEIDVSDPEGESLTTEWALRREVGTRSSGGEYEASPDLVALDIVSQDVSSLTFRAPDEAGEYRLFATTSDPQDKVGTANAPIFVK